MLREDGQRVGAALNMASKKREDEDDLREGEGEGGAKDRDDDKDDDEDDDDDEEGYFSSYSHFGIHEEMLKVFHHASLEALYHLSLLRCIARLSCSRMQCFFVGQSAH
jgi:hypothetical protein